VLTGEDETALTEWDGVKTAPRRGVSDQPPLSFDLCNHWIAIQGIPKHFAANDRNDHHTTGGVDEFNAYLHQLIVDRIIAER